jgi:HlyD family secretion protein
MSAFLSSIGAWIFSLAAMIIPGMGPAQIPQYNGYMEANYVYVASASPGRIVAIDVKEGQQVEQGEQLFWLEDDQLGAALRATEARQAVAEANWRNLETGGREQEVNVIRASLAKVEADQDLARLTLERTARLSEQGLVPMAKLDSDRAKLAATDALVAQLKAQLEVAELPARDAQIVAAEASLEAARAEVDVARSNLEDRRVTAPTGGLVERVYFRVGEVAATGVPVVAILPPEQLVARFFIPERDRAQFKLGERLDLNCDGCASGIVATLSYMASDPQHTPPIIYSRDERSRLVFMAEAQVTGASNMLPGQPITLVRQP